VTLQLRELEEVESLRREVVEPHPGRGRVQHAAGVHVVVVQAEERAGRHHGQRLRAGGGVDAGDRVPGLVVPVVGQEGWGRRRRSGSGVCEWRDGRWRQAVRSGERRVAGSVLARRARVVVVAAALASVVRRRRRRRPLEGDHVQAQVLAERTGC